MNEQRIMAGTIPLEDAIQRVIDDLRIPKELRVALAIYEDHRGGVDIREIDQLADGREGSISRSAICDSLAKIYRPCYEPVAIEQEIRIFLWHNDDALDWSLKLNGNRHEHITSEVMEALVECALITAQISLTRGMSQQLQ